MSFLQAEWRKLLLINYEFEDQILKKFVPNKTEIDKWNGRTYVSLVGFMFLNTKLLGIKIPFHVNFEEVNLRFYVKYKEGNSWKRGVVFIKEIVPKSALTFVANTIYKEHYQTLPMGHHWQELEDKRMVCYEWWLNKKRYFMKAEGDLNKKTIQEGSEEEFITEHYWGYTKVNDHKTYEYEVTHPKWEYYPITNWEIEVDFKAIYGKDFGSLNEQTPKSVMLAEGSQITVESKKEI